MVDRVLQFAQAHSLWRTGDSVVVALSGGADSVSLLHIFYSIKEKYSLNIYAAHLNHGIRGEEAARDENFCKILCKKYNVPLLVHHADIPKLARERRISEELCGRDERYAFLHRAAAERNAVIATAHNADDNAETLIFNLRRGTALTGAAGIPPKRGDIIRPLLTQTRAQIEVYCRENGLDHVTDSTNLSDDYTRNKIRHQITPRLRELNPRWEAAAYRFTQSAAEARDYLNAQARKALDESRTAYGYSAEILLKNHNAVLFTALSLLCDGCAERAHLELIVNILRDGGAVSLSGEKTAVCRQGVFRIKTNSDSKFLLEIPLNGEISFDFGDTMICAAVDNSKLENKTPVFRFRQSGDRFTYPKRGVTKPIRKMMNEQKIPSELRDGVLLLCLDDTVLWCGGVGFSAQGEELRAQAGLDIQMKKLEAPNA